MHLRDEALGLPVDDVCIGVEDVAGIFHPVVPELLLPFEISGGINLIVLDLLDYVTSVHIRGDESHDCFSSFVSLRLIIS